MTPNDWKKYIYAFLITAAIFGTALYIGNYFSNLRIEDLQATESRISLDILSSETQYALMGELSCPDPKNSVLSDELTSLGEKLDYSAGNGTTDPNFIALKKQYSLLEIKDYLLVKKLANCPNRPVTILYFYTDNCPDCDKEGYVLTYLRNQHPELRVYSFDYNLDLSALKTLASIYKIKETFPAIIIKGKTYSGFKSIEDIAALVPELAATSTNAAATSSSKK